VVAYTDADDDRISCPTCSLFRPLTGECLAERRDVGKHYHPTLIVPRRCEFYVPRKSVPDQRTGAQRWPLLMREYLAAFPPK